MSVTKFKIYGHYRFEFFHNLVKNFPFNMKLRNVKIFNFN